MQTNTWQTQKVNGRDEVLLNLENRATEYSKLLVENVREIMHDYEVDMYRLVIAVGDRFGWDTAYEMMFATVAEKRLKWLDQEKDNLELTGTEVEKGLKLYHKYFKPKEADFQIVIKNEESVVFKRKDFINAIYHACNVLDLDVIAVNNKVYSRAFNLMFEKMNLNLKHTFLDYQDGWYEESIVKSR